jgi:hypothetical protein
MGWRVLPRSVAQCVSRSSTGRVSTREKRDTSRERRPVGERLGDKPGS